MTREDAVWVGYQETTRSEGDSIGFKQAAARLHASSATAPAASRLRKTIERGMEHEARGLLNALGFLTRCLQIRGTPTQQREAWVCEIQEISERLECMYSLGLPRDFHL